MTEEPLAPRTPHTPTINSWLDRVFEDYRKLPLNIKAQLQYADYVLLRSRELKNGM